MSNPERRQSHHDMARRSQVIQAIANDEYISEVLGKLLKEADLKIPEGVSYGVEMLNHAWEKYEDQGATLEMAQEGIWRASCEVLWRDERVRVKNKISPAYTSDIIVAEFRAWEQEQANG